MNGTALRQPRQLADQRRDPRRIVRAVEDNARALTDHLEAAGPAHGRDCRTDRLVGDPPEPSPFLERRQRDRRVVDLEEAGKPWAQIADAAPSMIVEPLRRG